MIAYVCKYTPIEIFKALGEKVCRIEPSVTAFDYSDTLMHPNVCFYTKAVLEDIMLKDYEGVILTTCCDSMRRLYDILKAQFPDRFIYLLDAPRKLNELTVHTYQKEILTMAESYTKFSGKAFDEALLADYLKQTKAPEKKSTASPRIGILGARCNEALLRATQATDAQVVFNLTCTGHQRTFSLEAGQPVLRSYAKQLLDVFPCWRMEKANTRLSEILSLTDQVDGIIYHTVKFCENYSFEYSALKKNGKVPLLKLETDYSEQCEGQIKTRIEAFVESLKATHCQACYEDGVKPPYANEMKLRQAFSIEKTLNGKDAVMFNHHSTSQNTHASHETQYVLGIDSGSTSTNAVILDSNQKLVAFSIVRTGAKSGESAHKALETVLEKAHLTQDDLSFIVSTGYGRVSIPFANKNITEISCHGKGAHYLNPRIRTILDIGGQDSKAIKLSETGEVIDFVMNDKCAAGTGRFLEMMARSLEVDIKDMGPLSLKSKEDITISSMCSVFAESEVISLIAQNKEKADIIHGIHKGIAAKSVGLMSRVGKEGDFMMTGGVAKNIGVVRAVEEKLGSSLYISPEPEIVGALGAALFGLEEIARGSISEAQ